ncbi:MAG: nucleoside triphosphate pyrophosphohydrolase [Deltaproteobacteria bacterium]|nr:nucleoside triphosphate pyrophosphohydrolase [Deltaproteobacteria bacterium]
MRSCSNLTKFAAIIKKLRGKNGCPWDKKQNHKSLKPFLLEESYEVLDAIDKKNPAALKEELGDLLLQIFLHAQIADDHGQFDIEGVASVINEKIIRRHPHVFGDQKVKNADAVVKNWDKIKQAEKADHKKNTASVLDAIPKNFPSLFENYKLSAKAAKLGFEWQKPADVFDKVLEEFNEVKEALKNRNKTHLEEELGDLLFAAANLCRVYKVNPEIALNKANKKFRTRFGKMERQIKKSGTDFNTLSFEQWNSLWKQIKKT